MFPPTVQWHVLSSSASSARPYILQDYIQKNDDFEDANMLLILRSSYDASKHSWTPYTKEAVEGAISQQQPNDPSMISKTVQQIFILFWPAVLYLALLSIIMSFLLGYRGYNNRAFGLEWTERTMKKEDALILVFFYAAFGWALSNGLVLNSYPASYKDRTV